MSGLQTLKQHLQKESSTSEAWYLKQRLEQFEQCLRAAETNFTNAYNLALKLEKRISVPSTPSNE